MDAIQACLAVCSLAYIINNYIIICGMCSAKLRREARFCWKCNADQTVAGPPVEVNSKPQAESFGRPEVGKKGKPCLSKVI
jgi:predicted amidophosphoribosyltransferase